MISRNLSLKAVLLLVLYLTSYNNSRAQDSFIEFGRATMEEVNMKECSFDRTADAVVLLDQAVAYFDEQHQLITDRRIRLKILKEKGVERGSIRIPFYSGDNFEFIRDIEAMVITPAEDGSYQTLPLERKNIFTRQVNNLYSMVSFALPNVKVGSILDYKYRSIMKSYGGLKRWEFQTDIPVVASSYELAPIPNSEFAYTVYKSEDFPIQVIPNKEAGKVRFVMNNIPGLRDEVYMTTTKSFLQRVNFQFASYTSRAGTLNYTNTWKQLSDEMLDERAFGSQAKKDLSDAPVIKSLPSSLTPEEKLKSIFDFVRSHINWNNIYSKYSEDGVKTVLEKKKGNTGDINLLLVSLLRSAGLTAYPVLVSDRDQGLIDTTYSYLGQFGKVVALAQIADRQYVLDGTDMHTPFFMVPSDLLNTIGFVVDKKKHGFVYFSNLPHKQREVISFNSTIREDGVVEGTASIENGEYAKLALERRYNNEKSRYLEALLKPHTFLKIDSFAVEGLRSDSALLKEDVRFHYDLKKSGGYYLLNYNLFTGLTENPFITQYRFTDIDFGTKYSLVLSGNYTLPSSLIAETLPVNKKIVSPDRTMSVSRYVEKADNRISVKILMEINQEKYVADDYEMVKAVFKEAVNLLNEPVLLKAR